MKKMLKIGVRPQHSTKEEVASSKFKVQSWQPYSAPFPEQRDFRWSQGAGTKNCSIPLQGYGIQSGGSEKTQMNRKVRKKEAVEGQKR